MCVGFPEWNAQFSVWKTTGKDSSEASAIVCQNCAVYSVFPSGMTSHSNIAQCNWECIAPFTTVSAMRPCNLVEIYWKLYEPAWPSRHIGKITTQTIECRGSSFHRNVIITAYFNTTLTGWRGDVIFHRNVGNADFTSFPTLKFGHSVLLKRRQNHGASCLHSVPTYQLYSWRYGGPLRL